MDKKRILYFDLLKVLAIIAVVFNHTLSMLPFNTTPQLLIKSFFWLMVKWAVPVFIMVSGALMLKKNQSYKTIITKRIFRVFVPLVLINILWFIMKNYRFNDFILSFTTENFRVAYYSWYIYVIIGLYLVTPFIKKMVDNFEDKDYKLFTLIILFVPSMFNLLVSTLNTVGVIDRSFFPSIFSIIFSEYIGLYVAGYYIANKDITKKEAKLSVITLFISTLLALFIELLIKQNFSNYSGEIVDSCIIINTIVNALSIFVLVKYYLANKITNKLFDKVITTISECSFGIYLFHVFIIEVCISKSLLSGVFELNCYLGSLMLWFIAFVSSLILTCILRLIPFVKKIL